MSVRNEPFRVSTRLKDLIGRDLITDKAVAVFELVKNSFDAHATRVTIRFDNDRLVIADDGKGMSRDDILDKWLFVGYSAKREGEEDPGGVPATGTRRPYAGDKGIGRFSCDRLGESLTVVSRAASQPVQWVYIDWTKFEQKPRSEFRKVPVQLDEADRPPPTWPSLLDVGATGTTLDIVGLRRHWTRDDLLALRRGLEKLVSPFQDTNDHATIEICVPAEAEEDRKLLAKHRESEVINRPIQNTILDAINQRTTSIHVHTRKDSDILETRLVDRGDPIYTIQEPNPYELLVEPDIRFDVYFLNRKAKMVFARRMGVPSVSFGSIFLFRNGFRVFPIGEERDDFYGLNRRKQQGVRRFFGTRDLIGRIDVRASDGFHEATSRDRGLIRTPQVEELIECVLAKCIRRLERYVVDITWKDPFDKDQEDTSRIRLDSQVARVSALVAELAETKDVEIVHYNPDLVRIVDKKSEAFESSLNALAILAEKRGDLEIVQRVAAAQADVASLRAAERAASDARRRAELAEATAKRGAAKATEQFEQERQRNRFLVSASSLDEDTILYLHHQILIHAYDIQIGINRMMRKLLKTEPQSADIWTAFLEKMAYRISQIITASRFATKSGYRTGVVESEHDLVGYVRDYIEMVASLWAPRGIQIECRPGEGDFVRAFRPIDVGILIDNLVSNSAKAGASRILFATQIEKSQTPLLRLEVADNGSGWPGSIEPLSRVFEMGVTTTDGAGLGLFHVRQLIERLGGIIETRNTEYSSEFNGAYLTMRIGR